MYKVELYKVMTLLLKSTFNCLNMIINFSVYSGVTCGFSPINVLYHTECLYEYN